MPRPQAERPPAVKKRKFAPRAHPAWEGRLTRKVLVPIAVVAFALLGVFTWIAYQQRLAAARREAQTVAEAIHRQVVADRKYYTQNVVPPAKAAGVVVTQLHQAAGRPAIPLPTTFVREVAESLDATATQAEYKLALLSLFPVNPKQGPRSEAERGLMRANFLRRTEQATLTRVGEESYYTLYSPDLANAESCVTCHNALPESPKRDYVLGDVMGSMAITIPMTRRMREVTAGTLVEAGAFAAILIVAGTLIYYRAQRTVLTPIQRLASAATELATGNLATQVRIDSDDEIGQLAQSFTAMTATIRQVVDREVAGRQALDHTISEYLNFVEAVAAGDLTRQLAIGREAAQESRPLAVLGERINGLVERLGEMAAHLKVAGEKLESGDGDRAALARRLRELAARYRI